MCQYAWFMLLSQVNTVWRRFLHVCVKTAWSDHFEHFWTFCHKLNKSERSDKNIFTSFACVLRTCLLHFDRACSRLSILHLRVMLHGLPCLHPWWVDQNETKVIGTKKSLHVALFHACTWWKCSRDMINMKGPTFDTFDHFVHFFVFMKKSLLLSYVHNWKNRK